MAKMMEEARRGSMSPVNISDQALLTLPLNTGYVYASYVVHYEDFNVNKFFIQIKERLKAFKFSQMMKELDSTQPRDLVDAKDIKLGMPVLAYNFDKQRYCRGIIITTSNWVHTIFFVDFGNNEMKELSEIFKLPDQFVEVPILAHECILAPESKFSAITELSEHEEVKCEIVNDGKPCEVKISQSDSQSHYDTINLEVGDKYEVEVVCIKSVREFYIRMKSHERKLDLLQARLQVMCEEEESNNQIIDICDGKVCCAMNSKLQKWARGEILFATVSSSQVYFVDYGDEEMINNRLIKIIPPEMVLMLPTLAIRCNLHGFLKELPTNASIIKDTFQNMCEKKSIIAQVKNIGIKSTEVKLYVNDNCSSCINDLLQIQLKNEEADINIPKPKISKRETIFVTFFESIDRFFGQLAKISVDHLNDFQKELQKYSKVMKQKGLQQIVLSKIKCDNMACSAKYPGDQQFYRGKIISGTALKAKIYFVDYGNTEEIRFNDIVQLNSKLTAFPRMGFMCSCGDTLAYGSDFETVKKAIYNQTLEVEIVGMIDDDTYKVIFPDSSLNKDVCKLFFQSTEKSKPSRRSIMNKSPRTPSTFRNLKIVKDKQAVGELIHFTSWKRVFFHLNSHKQDVENIQQAVETAAKENTQVLDNIFIGMPCLARFSSDDCWYRALIENVNDEQSFVVQFVDFGNSDVVNKKYLLPIPELLMYQPRLTFACSLSNHPDFEIPEDILEKFENEALNKYFVIKFKGELVSPFQPVEFEFLDALGKSLIENFTTEAMQRQGYGANSRSMGSENGEAYFSAKDYSTVRPQYQNSSGPREFNYKENNSTTNSLRWENGSNKSVNYNFNSDRNWSTDYHRNDKNSYSNNSDNNQRHYDQNDRRRSQYSDSPDSNRNRSRNSDYGHRNYQQGNGVSIEIGKDGYGREIPPRYQNKDFTNGTRYRRNESTDDSGRGYGSRNFSQTNGKASGDYHSRHESSFSRGDRNDWHNATGYSTKSKNWSANSWSNSDKKSSNSQSNNLNARQVAIGDYKEVSVCHVVDPGEFYCYLIDYVNQTRYQEMSKKLNAFCKGGEAKNLWDCAVGSFCSACFSDDGEWYRAKVIKIMDDEAEVYFVDYGNSSKVQISSLKTLENEFLALPAKAIRCSFHNIKHSGKKWEIADISYFRDLISQKTFLAHFKCKDQNGGHAIDMMALSSFSDFSLRYELMIQKNFRPDLSHDPVYLKVSDLALHLNPFSSIKCVAGQKEKAFVTWANSVTEMYVRLLKKEDNWKQFELKLNQYYSSIKADELTIDTPERGMSCAATYTYDGKRDWYRAYILAFDNQEILVKYVDYGNIGRVTLSELKVLNSDFIDLPAQAILLKLSGIKPVIAKWDSDLQTVLGKYFADDLECHFIECLGDKYLANILVNDVNVNTELVDDGLAWYAEQYDVNVSPHVNNLASEILSNEFVPVEDVVIEEDQLIGSSSQVQEVVEDFKDTSCIKVDACLDALSTSETKKDQKFKGCISHFNSVNSFYVQNSDHYDDLIKLSDALYSTYNETEAEESLDLKEGDLCAALYSVDSNWYRAKILGEKDFGYTLLFIDYGNVDWVLMSEIRLLSDENLINVKPYSVHCNLDGVPTISDEKLLEDINSTFRSAAVGEEHEYIDFTISEITKEDIYSVKLKIDGVDITQMIVDKFNLASVCDRNLEFPKLNHQPNSVLKVHVSYIESPSRFWIFCEDDDEKLCQLTEEIAICAESAALVCPKTLKTGTGVIANYSVDGNWYRAVINSVSDLSANVLFVDYGNYADVSFKDIRNLPEKFFEIPSLALECNLFGVNKPTTGWSAALMDKFRLFETQGTSFNAKIMDVKDDIYFVILYDVESEENINDTFVEKTDLPSTATDVANTVTDVNNTATDDNITATDVNITATDVNITAKGVTPELKLGERTLVTISFITSPSEFWIQRAADIKKLEDLSTSINEICSAADEKLDAADIKIGEVYAVQFFIDELWYRAQILSETDGKFLVHFVDYGNCETVSVESILNLDAEFLGGPFFGIKCGLLGFNDVEVPSQTTDFKENYANKVFVGEFIEKKEDLKYVVRLFDMGFDVGKKLTGEQDEVKVEDEQVQDDESFETEGELKAETDESGTHSASSIDISSSSSQSFSQSVQNSTDSSSGRISTSETDISIKVLEESTSVSTVALDETCNLGKNVETSQNLTTEKFTSRLEIPSYADFAESAASHPRSLSPVFNLNLIKNDTATNEPADNEDAEVERDDTVSEIVSAAGPELCLVKALEAIHLDEKSTNLHKEAEIDSTVDNICEESEKVSTEDDSTSDSDSATIQNRSFETEGTV